MSCTASHSMTTVHCQVEPQMEESSAQRRGSRAYQIFPEPNTDDDSDSYPEDFMYTRERLPSIVVDPTEICEELSWPGQGTGDEENREDSVADHADASADAEQPEDGRMDEGSASRKSSIGPSQSQLSLSRLTPPPSPTRREEAPPCLRS